MLPEDEKLKKQIFNSIHCELEKLINPRIDACGLVWCGEPRIAMSHCLWSICDIEIKDDILIYTYDDQQVRNLDPFKVSLADPSFIEKIAFFINKCFNEANLIFE